MAVIYFLNYSTGDIIVFIVCVIIVYFHMITPFSSNSSFQLPGLCMPRMLKEAEDGNNSDGGSFEAVTPEHDCKNQDSCEVTTVATEKHRHIMEDVDGELEMEDVAPSSDIITDRTAVAAVDASQDAHSCKEQFSAFAPPLPHDIPPLAPPLPTPAPPLPPLPPPPRPPLPPTIALHVSTKSI